MTGAVPVDRTEAAYLPCCGSLNGEHRPDCTAVPVDRTPLDLDAEISAAIHRIEDRLPTAPATHVFSTAEAIVAPLVAELAQARADLVETRQGRSDAIFELHNVRAECDDLSAREAEAQAENARLAARVEAAKKVADEIAGEDGPLLRWAEHRLRAALAVPAAEEATDAD